MNFERKSLDTYLKHKVFKDLKYMMDFYDSISMSCSNFITSGTNGIPNYASFVFAAIEGTLESISTLLYKGRINDAYTLIRKLFDDILLEIYIDVTLKDKISLENLLVDEVNEWLQGRLRIPKTKTIMKCLELSEWTKDLYPLFGWDTYLMRNRELLNDSVHSNRFQQMLLNCNDIYIENRDCHLKNCEIILNQLFLLHMSFIFHLNPQYLTSSDYMDHLEEGQTPPAGCQNWIAPFAQDAYNKVVKPHEDIAEFVKKTCGLDMK